MAARCRGTDVVAAYRFADACARSVAEFFTEYDYLLTPTTACVSWPVEQVYPRVIENREVGPRGHAAFTPLFNLALVPGISVPCGTGRDGLPVGLQIVAPRLHDRPLLALAQGSGKCAAGLKYDCDLLLDGAKRNQVLGLGEVRRYGATAGNRKATLAGPRIYF